MTSDPLLGRTLGDFEIEALIGKGGMGSVYRAEQRKLGRKVALKVLSAELASSEEFRARFLAESHTAASIDHPNILPVFDAGEADGLLYIAMRLVEGSEIDLQSLLEREGALRPERALAIVAQVASALDAAHARGLVHRDVKPGNVLLAADHVYLTDFGIAKVTSGRRELTRTGAFLGTLDYASPEQIRNDPVDGASDIYSLGAVLFHCLSGTVPFDRSSEYGVMKAHLEEPPPLISAVRSELSATLDAVFATAMAKEKDERYRSGRHLAEAARAALEGRAAARTVAAPIAAVAPTVIARPKAPAPTEPLTHQPRLPWTRLAVGAVVLAVAAGATVAGAFGPGSSATPSPTVAAVVATAPPSLSPTPTASPTASASPPPTPSASATPNGLPLWIQRLKDNPIVPGVGVASIRLGDSETAVTSALGKPAEVRPVTTVDGRLLDYAVLYFYESVFLGIYTSPEGRRVQSIRLSDSSFNTSGLIPQVRPGAGIGASATALVNAMGEPRSKSEHFTCPKQGVEGDVRTTTYSYVGIDFWVCSNARVYLIDVVP